MHTSKFHRYLNTHCASYSHHPEISQNELLTSDTKAFFFVIAEKTTNQQGKIEEQFCKMVHYAGKTNYCDTCT